MTITKRLEAVFLLIDSCHGIFVPQRFIKYRDLTKWKGISEENASILLSGPDNEFYWDAWNDVLSNAEYDNNGDIYRITQDGDLWAYCFELMTNEEKQNFGMDD